MWKKLVGIHHKHELSYEIMKKLKFIKHVEMKFE